MQIYYYNKFKNEKGESHRLLEKAIAEFLGDNSRESAAELVADIETGEMGKPSIPGFNDFSITHSENTWAVLIADGYGNDHYCGLDIQYGKKTDVNKLAERWFHEEEAEAVKARGEDEFFRIWARREALVKAVGTSIVNAHLPNTLDDTVEFEGVVWQINDIEIPDAPGAFAAVCAQEITEIKLTELRVTELDG